MECSSATSISQAPGFTASFTNTCGRYMPLRRFIRSIAFETKTVARTTLSESARGGWSRSGQSSVLRHSIWGLRIPGFFGQRPGSCLGDRVGAILQADLPHDRRKSRVGADFVEDGI